MRIVRHRGVADSCKSKDAPDVLTQILRGEESARLGEIRCLRWSEIDFERACLRLPDSKTGYKVIQLGAAALELLAAQERRSDYVFPSEVKIGHPITDVSYVWERIRKAAGLPGVRIHDLRHSFASNIVNAGGSLPVIGALLGHRHVATTQRCAHLDRDPGGVRNAAGWPAHPLARGRDGLGARSGAANARS